ncbi:MAG: glycosyltransferase family 2 protein, partial [Prevotellaceae bacterium]|nr:glycosyltransferase family 2 protein [Prevotellaceae bacterium]
MKKISAVIITYNEERNIARCLQSLQGVADEIMVVDSGSTDKTEEICRQLGVTSFIRHPFEGYVQQKNWAMEQATYSHILSLDADEALSDELKKSILEVKESWTADAYKFNRLTSYCGKWIRHCSWYPDVKLRLWDRRKGRWGGVNPHDKMVMERDASVIHLKGDLLHYSYHNVSDYILQVNKFTEIGA